MSSSPSKSEKKMSEEASQLKRKGNESFVKQDFDRAISYYSDAIDLIIDDNTCPAKDKSVLYANRAECYLRLNKYKNALNDCDLSLKYDNTNIKAKFRRSKANISLNNFDKAKKDLIYILKKDEKNIKAMDLMREIARKTGEKIDYLNNKNNKKNNNKLKNKLNSKYDPETDVSWDDQNDICQYNIYNHLKTEYEDKLIILNKKLTGIKDSLENIEMLIDDDACKLEIGNCFIQISNENCENSIKKEEKLIKKEIKQYNNKLNNLIKVMTKLRAKLKSKFGDHIGLPEIRANSLLN